MPVLPALVRRDPLQRNGGETSQKLGHMRQLSHPLSAKTVHPNTKMGHESSFAASCRTIASPFASSQPSHTNTFLTDRTDFAKLEYLRAFLQPDLGGTVGNYLHSLHMAQRHVGPNPILDAMDTGSTAFSSRWRAWQSQWTQPQLLRLCDALLGARLFHSSQMGGFSSQKLRQPGPLVFVAVGYFNLAHATSLGLPQHLIEVAPDIGVPTKLPDAMRALWEGREPFTDANGVVLGPQGLFMAFSGLRELTANDARQLSADDEAAASQALGRWLRLRLAAKGMDWLGELPSLRLVCPSIEPLLMGKTVPADRLLMHLPRLAALADATDAELWDVVETGLANASATATLPT